jgi:thioredoxin 1
MQEVIIISSEELSKFISIKGISVVYFSTPECGVCKIIKPKLIDLLNENFPKVLFGYVDMSLQKELSAQLSIFTVPTIIVYVEGKEFIRESRNIDFSSLSSKIERTYNLIYN